MIATIPAGFSTYVEAPIDTGKEVYAYEHTITGTFPIVPITLPTITGFTTTYSIVAADPILIYNATEYPSGLETLATTVIVNADLTLTITLDPTIILTTPITSVTYTANHVQFYTGTEPTAARLNYSTTTLTFVSSAAGAFTGTYPVAGFLRVGDAINVLIATVPTAVVLLTVVEADAGGGLTQYTCTFDPLITPDVSTAATVSPRDVLVGSTITRVADTFTAVVYPVYNPAPDIAAPKWRHLQRRILAWEGTSLNADADMEYAVSI